MISPSITLLIRWITQWVFGGGANVPPLQIAVPRAGAHAWIAERIFARWTDVGRKLTRRAEIGGIAEGVFGSGTDIHTRLDLWVLVPTKKALDLTDKARWIVTLPVGRARVVEDGVLDLFQQ